MINTNFFFISDETEIHVCLFQFYPLVDYHKYVYDVRFIHFEFNQSFDDARLKEEREREK